METHETAAFRKTAETFIAGAKTLPQHYLISPEIFVREQERIFSTQWLCAGHQSQAARARDYFVVEAAGESVVIVRDQNGKLGGFYNVCRHRGTRICAERSGQFRETIRCPYHAW